MEAEDVVPDHWTFASRKMARNRTCQADDENMLHRSSNTMLQAVISCICLSFVKTLLQTSRIEEGQAPSENLALSKKSTPGHFEDRKDWPCISEEF